MSIFAILLCLVLVCLLLHFLYYAIHVVTFYIMLALGYVDSSEDFQFYFDINFWWEENNG